MDGMKELKFKAENMPVMTGRMKDIIPLMIAFLVPFLLYLKTLGYGFTYFDDNELISENIQFLSDRGNIGRVFFTNAFISSSSPFYRPLQTLSFMIDIFISGGENHWMFHLSNVVIFASVSCLIYILFRLFAFSRNLAIAGTLIFAVHPLFVSTVAWIPARGDLLLTFFALLSFIFFIRYSDTKKFSRLLLSWLAFTFALFSKETAAVLPVLLIIYYLLFSGKRSIDLKLLTVILLFLTSGACWFFLRNKALGGFQGNDDGFALMSLIYNLRIIPESLAKFAIPYDNAPIPGYSFIKTLSGLLLILITGFLLTRTKSVSPKVKVFWFSWFFLLMLPPMFYKVTFIDYLDHRFTLPMLGIFMLSMYLIQGSVGSSRVYKVSVILGLMMFVLNLFKSSAYSDPLRFYSMSVKLNLTSAFARNNLATLLLNRGDLKAALMELTRAVELKDDYDKAYLNRGTVLCGLGEYEKALDDFTTLIRLDPKNAEGYSNRGGVYFQLGDHPNALKDFNRAIELKPSYAAAYYNRAMLYDEQGSYEKAIQDYSESILLKPGDFDSYNNRALIYYKTGSFEKAITDYSKAIDIHPGKIDLYYNRGNSYFQAGSYDLAINDYTRIIEMDPQNPEVYINRGIAYLRLDSVHLACLDFMASETNGNEKAIAFLEKYCR